MVLTASTMLPLGTAAPDFQLPEVVTGEQISLATFAESKALLVMFICQHCPFVKHVQSQLAQLGQDYHPQEVGIVAISANNQDTHPEDSPEHLRIMAKTLNFTFALCHDETQATAIAYTAACTPDFFVFNRDRRLVYRGQLDDSRPSNNRLVTGADLRAALDAVLADQPVNPQQNSSIGCSIKWKPGHEPAYFL
ncbi:MAG: thioredoxin family protein [Acaryochloridaceae cyanobacterium CSU_5_19]|nr:thioredoxin family protein [Acaryochloridaceae cyanobacterium CSU_5_19]